MAFRRRFNPRFSRRGARAPRRTGVTAAVASRLARKANKRFHWVTLSDTMCEPLGLDCKGCCEDPEDPERGIIRGCIYDDEGAVESNVPQPYSVVIVGPLDNSEISPVDTTRAPYEPDTLTIVKLAGHIELCPAFCASEARFAACASQPTQCSQFEAFESNLRTMHLRAGLSKDKWEWDPVVRDYSTPTRYPLDPEEWSDAQFLRQWERINAHSTSSRGVHILPPNAPLGCCSDVSAAAAGAPANTLSSGSGTVNIPAISTDCEPCLPGEFGTDRGSTSTYREFPCIRLPLSSRRRLTFKENEGLTMWIDWTSFTPGFGATLPNWRPNVGFYMRTFVKALVETV